MANYASESGRLSYQLGDILTRINNAVERSDVIAQANLTDSLLTVCTPKILEKETGKIEDMLRKRDELRAPLEDAKRAHIDDDSREQDTRGALHDACQLLVARILCLMAQRNIYAYKETPIGSSTGLWQPKEDAPDDSEATT